MHQISEFSGSSLSFLVMYLPWHGSKAIQSYTSQILKFAINTAQDTLPHYANLALWRKESGVSDKCKLCGVRQTLQHILNCCQVALKYRRYNERHDEVLRTITTYMYMKEEISDDFTVVADLDDHQSYLFPPQLAVSDLRPDVVMFSQLQKAAFILELTICSEVSYAAAQERKTAKYMELVSEVEKN